MGNNKGLTLIEVILTIAIISIMAVTILGVFNIGITNIFESGNGTDEMFKASQEIDEKIKYNEKIKNDVNEITVTIEGIESILIEGIIIKSSDGKIETFVPSKSD